MRDPNPVPQAALLQSNHHLAEYVSSVFEDCPGSDAGSTRHEDCIPMASSSYGRFWALDGEACAEAAKGVFTKDIEALDTLRAKIR